MNLAKRSKLPVGAGLVVGLAAALVAPTAMAQSEAPAAAADPAAGAAAPAAQPQPVAVETTAQADVAPVAEAAPAPAESAPAMAEAPAEPEREATEQKEEASSPIALSMFADAYFAVQTNNRGTTATRSGHRSYAGQGPTGLSENGFSLSFLGLDASYDGGEIGATTSLRFGSSVPIFHGNDPGLGIDNIFQGYLTWTPSDAVKLDAGMFGTIFGAEVAESWNNLNYTRGALYYYAQPFWHTGLRGNFALSDTLGLTAMVVNGTNNISETVDGPDDLPSVALQAAYAPADEFALYVGGMMATNDEAENDVGFDIFGDLVAVITLDALQFVLNADVIQTKGQDGADDRTFFGASLAAGYSFSDSFGIAVRGEHLIDDPGGDADSWELTTLTGTLDFKPVPGMSNFIVRLDNRFETSNQDVFGVSADPDAMDPGGKDSWFSSVLGLVVHTP